jgi:EPS-associated MarR family transcriptional regulator
MSQNSDTLEYDYRVLQLIEERPDISQRELSSQLGVSVGKTNYVLSALIERGLVKAENFKRSNNKAGYLYLLTPKGISDKGVITARFLKRKVEEYERLKAEIADIQSRIEE